MGQLLSARIPQLCLTLITLTLYPLLITYLLTPALLFLPTIRPETSNLTLLLTIFSTVFVSNTKAREFADALGHKRGLSESEQVMVTMRRMTMRRVKMRRVKMLMKMKMGVMLIAP
jgi:hypothetical protein